MAKRITKAKAKPKAARKSPKQPARTKAPKHKDSASPKRESRARQPAAASVVPPRPVFLAVGIHAGVDYQRYHDDPAPEPSLSSSFIKRVEASSPRHAWLTHPRLTKDYQRPRPSREMDFGSAAHAHLLQSQELHIINADDFKSPAIRTIRDRARASGFCPVLKRDYATIAAMRETLLAELGATELAGVFDNVKGALNECVAIWKEDGFHFRARADRWIPPFAMGRWAHGLIIDYKTTWESAAADRWPGTVFNTGADFQSVLYPEGFALAQVQSRHGAAEGQAIRRPAFRYIVQECEPPYEFQIFGPSEITREHVTSKIVRAFDKIKGAWQAKKPPGYPRQTVEFDPPAWELKREERAQLAALATA